MKWKRVLVLGCITLGMLTGLAAERTQTVSAEPDALSGPIQAGCYLARHDRCKIHVEPLTINLTTGNKLASVQLFAVPGSSGQPALLYDFRTDASNPLPLSGTVVTLTQVARDFGVSCGASYTVTLQAREVGSPGYTSLGSTSQLTCPTGTFLIHLPALVK